MNWVGLGGRKSWLILIYYCSILWRDWGKSHKPCRHWNLGLPEFEAAILTNLLRLQLLLQWLTRIFQMFYLLFYVPRWSWYSFLEDTNLLCKAVQYHETLSFSFVTYKPYWKILVNKLFRWSDLYPVSSADNLVFFL